MIRRVPVVAGAEAATEAVTEAAAVTAAGATYSFPAPVVRVAGEQAAAGAEATAAAREAETMSQAMDSGLH